jgi:AcrR family transcriptional regulator
MTHDRPKRPRNAAATREAILQSARIAFSRAGYDGVGVREIAREAGITAILVNRYFGSKEELFAEIVRDAFSQDRSLATDMATFGESVARAIIAKAAQPEADFDPLLLTLRSASNEKAAAILRENLADCFEKPLANAIGGRLGPERAALILSLIAGYDLMRKLIKSPGLANAKEADLTALFGRLLNVLVRDDADGRPVSSDSKNTPPKKARRR